MTTAWTRAHLDRLDDARAQIPVLEASQVAPVIEDLHLWDLWPIRRRDGACVVVDGTEYWMALSAPRALEPSARHDVARIRLLSVDATGWHDRGPVFPDDTSPGRREWAGSAVYDEDLGRVVVRYTAAGYRGETEITFAQRLFEASAAFDPGDPALVSEWSTQDELIAQGRGHYRSTLEQTTGRAGYIKAFRDPCVFHDPVSDAEYLLFTASLADSATDFDAAVGVAVRPDPSVAWVLQEPVLHADGVNNEMERPHVVRHGGLYYLFFSTQARTFHPDLTGPTGLYGFVADSMAGSWTPVNGSGLVLRNPVAEPFQCYSWLVLDDLQVTSFVDMHSLGGRDPDVVEAAGEMRGHFGGTPAPRIGLLLDGDRAILAP